MTFADDLKFGNKYEQDCISRLKNAKIIKGNFKPYDIIDEDGIKYECKSDRLAFKKGNLCIEFECNKKPSGISSTESDFYFYYIITDTEPEVYKIPTNDIRTMIDNKDYHRVMNGGDGYRSRFYLFKKTLFQNYLHGSKS